MRKVLIFVILTLFLLSFVIAIEGNNTEVECIQKENSCCLGEICVEVSIICLENQEVVFEGCDNNCMPKASCKESDEISEEKVCCKIYGLGSMMEQVNIHYKLLERSECKIPEGFVGGGREVVDDEYCEISEGCKPICKAIGSKSEGWYDSCTNKLIEYANCGREFCGISTYGVCESDDDCIEGGGCSGEVCQSKDEEEMITTCEWRDCYDAEEYSMNCVCINNKCRWFNRRRVRALTIGQVQEVIRIKNRLRINQTECPENCTCTGSVTKCRIEGGRNMTIRAGKSGNVIVQVKEVNMTTNVTLYKSAEGKVYGIFRNNQTKEINFLPDHVQEKIRERIRARLENQTIELDEDGIYRIQGKKKARLFFLFPVREKMRMQIDSETGELIKIRNPWWGFLARDTEEEAEDEED